MLYWNLDWNTSQDREDLSNSPGNLKSYQSSSSVLLETLSLSELSLELSDESSQISKVLHFFKVDFCLSHVYTHLYINGLYITLYI